MGMIERKINWKKRTNIYGGGSSDVCEVLIWTEDNNNSASKGFQEQKVKVKGPKKESNFNYLDNTGKPKSGGANHQQAIQVKVPHTHTHTTTENFDVCLVCILRGFWWCQKKRKVNIERDKNKKKLNDNEYI